MKHRPTPASVSRLSSPRLCSPPAGDEPLDAVELALVRAFVSVIGQELREEEAGSSMVGAATTTAPVTEPQSADTAGHA